MRILLSGGWGYGNLGDDAILTASIKLIRQKWPNAELIVTTYSPDYTKSLVAQSAQSMHRVLFGDSAFKFLHTYQHSFDDTKLPSFPLRVYNKVRSLDFFLYNSDKVYKKTVQSRAYSQLEMLFEQSDLFIMSGGGYFNNWTESFISRIEELKLAKKHKVPIYIIGQTFAHFEDAKRPLFQQHISDACKICVRDESSRAELRSIGVNSLLIPDLALSLNYEDAEIPKKELLFIPAELLTKSRQAIIKALIDFSLSSNTPVRVAITRLYNRDVAEAKRIFKELKRANVDAALTIPENFEQLKSIFQTARIVVSRNLHGLILGYVSGCHGLICLNTDWKFTGFMKQINASDFIVREDEDNKTVILNLINRISAKPFDTTLRAEIRQTVTSDFLNLF